MTTPKMIDEFLIGKPIGKGAEAVVYAATDTTSGAQVALKVYHSGRATHEPAAPQFPDQSGIARTIAVRKGYRVLELAKGVALRKLIEKFPNGLPHSYLLSVTYQVLGVCGAAHRTGLMHGDLKPEHVIVDEDGGTVRGVTLVDPGYRRAGALKQSLASESPSFQTVAYSPPERHNGAEPRPADDLFAVGAMLFECATGKRPVEFGARPSMLRPDLPTWVDEVFRAAYVGRTEVAADLVAMLFDQAKAVTDEEEPAPIQASESRIFEGTAATIIGTTTLIVLSALLLSLCGQAPLSSTGAKTTATARQTLVPSTSTSAANAKDVAALERRLESVERSREEAAGQLVAAEARVRDLSDAVAGVRAGNSGEIKELTARLGAASEESARIAAALEEERHRVTALSAALERERTRTATPADTTPSLTDSKAAAAASSSSAGRAQAPSKSGSERPIREKKPCPTCGSTGSRACANCAGRGRRDQVVERIAVLGGWSREIVSISCEECAGTGRRRCGSCQGTGMRTRTTR